jgi:hypothetical protein
MSFTLNEWARAAVRTKDTYLSDQGSALRAQTSITNVWGSAALWAAGRGAAKYQGVANHVHKSCNR